MGNELQKGNTSMLVLSILCDKEMYGYQIIQELQARSDNVFSLKEGTLYPLLHSMEKAKFLDTFWEQTETGRKRKYYRITKLGKKELASQLDQWDIYSNAVHKVVTSICT